MNSFLTVIPAKAGIHRVARQAFSFLATITLAVGLFLSVPSEVFASNICTTGTFCTRDQVGWFMEGISRDCGNLGNCTLEDIMVVVKQVGNTVLMLVGSVVLLFFVIGGILMIASMGDPKRITKGKDMIKGAVFGLIIVFSANLGIRTLVEVLKSGGTTEGGCTPEMLSKGSACGLNMKCTYLDDTPGCYSECELRNQDSAVKYSCQDSNAYDKATETEGVCIPDLCPGDKTNMCCPSVAKTFGL